MFTRKTTHPVQIGPLTIGHCDQVMIQSMTNTKTADVIKTIKQIKTLVSLGCKLVRVAIVDQKDIQGLKQIVQKKICPIVADIHYDYHLALAAIATGVAKIRINPNNITSTAKLKAIVLAAKKHHTAIRLGINQGSMIGGVKTSLSAIVQYAINIIKQFERWGFKQIVVSLKTSDPLKTQQLYFLAAKKIKYPLHLGVTEAGNQNRAIIKSVIGLTPLIQAGIGDTIRISITNNPLSEPVVAKHLLGTLGLYQDYVNVISCPTCGRLQWNLTKLLSQVENYTNQVPVKLNIAILGCSVNGIGESQKADIGVYGNKTQNFIYFKGKLHKIVAHHVAFNEIKKLIKRF